MTYKDQHYLFGNISTSLTYIFSNKRTSRIFSIGFAHSKWPHLQWAYLLGVWHSFSVTVLSCFRYLSWQFWLNMRFSSSWYFYFLFASLWMNLKWLSEKGTKITLKTPIQKLKSLTFHFGIQSLMRFPFTFVYISEKLTSNGLSLFYFP